MKTSRCLSEKHTHTFTKLELAFTIYIIHPHLIDTTKLTREMICSGYISRVIIVTPMCIHPIEHASPSSISVQFMFEKWLETRMERYIVHACGELAMANNPRNQCICMSHVQDVCICVCIGVAVHVNNMLRNSRNVLVENTTHTTVVFCSMYSALNL